MSLELVVLIPVLVLLTLFVLWAGQGGRAGLAADLAAEEAATAAALCCGEDDGGGPDREALVQDILEARPGLEDLCVGGLRPGAEPDRAWGPDQFVREEWLEFDPGRHVGGLGVLSVQFLCETDGAVAPLRGLLPTVTFHGQASEVVLRQPLPVEIGFEQAVYSGKEGENLVVTLTTGNPVPYELQLDYAIEPGTASQGDDYLAPPNSATSGTASTGTVTFDSGEQTVEIVLALIDDGLYEGAVRETILMRLSNLIDPVTGSAPLEADASLDPGRLEARGEIEDISPRPHLFVSSVSRPCEVQEGHTATFEVRLRDEHNRVDAPSAIPVTVDFGTAPTGTGVGHAVGGDEPPADYEERPPSTLTFVSTHTSWEVNETVVVQIHDDEERPEGEPDETFKVVLENPRGAPLGHRPAEALCTIIDDEIDISVTAVEVDEDDGELKFQVRLSDKPDGDIQLRFELRDYLRSDPADRATRGSCGSGVDYEELDNTAAVLTIPSSHDPTQDKVEMAVTICVDRVVERDETFWLHVERGDFGEAIIEPDGGAVGTILNDDNPVIAIGDKTCAADDPSCEEWTAQEPFEPLAHDPNQDPADRVMTFTVNLLLGSCSDQDHKTETDCEAAGETWSLAPAELAETVSVDYAVQESSPVSAQAGSDYASPGSCSKQAYTTEAGCEGAGGAWTPLSGTLTFGACTDTTHTTQQACEDASRTWEGTSAAQDVPVVLLPDYDAEPDDETFELRGSDAGNADGISLAEAVATATITDNPPPALTVEGNSVGEGEELDFTVKLLRARTRPVVSVDWTAMTHVAVAGKDFEAVSDELELRKGDETKTVSVTTFSDAIVEIDETMHLVLSRATASIDGEVIPNGVTIEGPGVGTIEDVSPVVVRADTPNADESKDLVFTISIIDFNGDPAVITENLRVHHYTADGLATGGAGCSADYTTRARSSLTFEPGKATEQSVTVKTCTDLFDEADETVLLVLELDEGTHHAAVGDFGVGTIVDTSDPPIIRITDAAAQEGNPLAFEVKLMARDADDNLIESPSFQPVAVTIATSDGTAKAPGDYTALPSQTLTIPAYRSSVLLEVGTNRDTLDDEIPETLFVELSGPDNAVLDKAYAVGTIHPRCIDMRIDDEENRPPDVIVPDQIIAERAHYEVKVRFSRPMCTGVLVQWDEESGEVDGTTFGTMTAKYEDPPDWDTDLVIRRTGEFQHPLHERYIFAMDDHDDQYGISGPVTLGWSFSLEDDSLDEDDEWFTLRARWGPSMPDHYQGLGWATGRVTVVDDDPPPGLTVQDASAKEGSDMSFTVSLDARSGRTVAVEYRTADRSGTGAATAGSDYTAVPWTRLTIAPGETSATFTVEIATDTDTDPDETFLVELRAPESSDPNDPAPAMNAQIIDGVAVGTILEGDPPVLSIADASGDEGFSMAFTMTLDGTVTETATVKASTEAMPQGATAAVAGSDYTTASHTLTIPAGTSGGTWTFNVPILTDALDEPDETFLVQLSDPVNVSLADPSAVGTINGNVDCYDVRNISTSNKLAKPELTADDPTVDEGAGAMRVDLTVAKPYCADNKVEMSPWILGTATEKADFNLPVSEIWFDALETTTTFSLEVIDDDRVELDETVVINLVTDGSPRNPWIGVEPFGTRSFIEVTGTITDNDEASLRVEDASGGEGDTLAFTLTLDKEVHSDVTVDYATADGTATAPADYTAASATATIPAGRFTTTVSVSTTQDSAVEGDETFELRLTNPVNALVPAGEAAAAGTIRDDDIPSVRISNAAGDEGAALTFTVSIDMAIAQDITIGYATSDGTATALADYTAVPDGSVTIRAGETSATFTVATVADAEAESAERFFVDVEAGGATYRIDDGRGVGVIRDVSRRALTVSDAYAVEGSALGFRVGFEGPPVDADITVGYRTVAGTATAGDDYSGDFESAARTLRIVAGSTGATVSVATVQDTLDEDVERLELVLSDPGDGAVLAADRASGVIIDDDPEPVVSVGDAEATENGDGVPVTFTVSLSEVSGREVSVPYATVDASAAAGDDYVAAMSGAQVTVPAGNTTAAIEVALVNDDDAEEVERFLLELSSPTGARVGDGIGAGTILDDDGEVQILIDDAPQVYEGPDAAAVFEVRLSRAADDEVTVTYSTADFTAAAGADYTTASGTLTFAIGDTVKTVSVDLIDDNVEESTETFRLELTDPSSNARLGDDPATASAVIVDDDGEPELSVLDASGTEGAGAVFEVRLSAPSSQDVTVDYAAVRDPTAAAPVAAAPTQDFDPVAGTLTVTARSLSATVTVPLPDDSLDEHAERFWLRLSNPVDATIADGTATGTVIDNDPLPRLSIGDAAAAEGDTAAFTVQLEPVSGRTVTVPWTTAVSSGDHPASPTVDYTSASGTLTFAAGATSARIDIATVDDDEPEDDETFLVSLGPPTNAALGNADAVGTIHDDDAQPRITILDARPVREDSGPAVFRVRLNRSSTEVVTVDYATSDGTAVAGEDYDAAAGSLSIPVGLTTAEISVAVVDDDVTEDVETFNITLSNPGNAVIADGAATATIRDDELPNITIASASAGEGDGTIDFAVTLDQAGSDDITVNYATFDGTAVQPGDYATASGTLTFAAGETEASIAVTLTDDAFTEDTETFRVRLSTAEGATIATADAVGTITDDDDLPVIGVGRRGGHYILENQGSVSLRFSLSRASDVEVSASYRIEGGGRSGTCPAVLGEAARAGGTITFPPGSTAQELTLTLIDNDVFCGAREYGIALTLFDPVNAVLAPVHWIGIDIIDDDAPTLLRFFGGRALESSGRVTVVARAFPPSDSDIAVRYFTFSWGDGEPEATPNTDYRAASGTWTIPAGAIEAELALTIIDDNTAEPDEYFWVEFAYDAGDEDPTGFAELFILDDDTLPELSVEDVYVAEDAGAASFRILLDGMSGEDVRVRIATADGTATEPADYRAASVTLTIPAGNFGTTVWVPLVDDDEEEGDETFTLTLSGATGATISDATATATIDDDEDDGSEPVIAIGALAVSESFETRRFPSVIPHPVTLSQASDQTVSVDWRIESQPSLGQRAAVEGVDYRVHSRTGTVTFAPGDTYATISAAEVLADFTPEHDEVFAVVLFNPVNAVLGNNATAGVTILDDDQPTVTIADATASESAGFATFTVTLHAPGILPGTLDYATSVRGSAGSAAATPDDDYTETTGTLSIPAGVQSATFTVPITGDSADEVDETFLVTISNPVGLAITDPIAVGTITDDDPGWTIDDRSVWENAGTMNFTVERDHTSNDPVTLNYRIAAVGSAVGGASCSTDGVDYETPSGSVTLQPTDTTATISITLCDDTDVEGKETLLIELTGVPGRKLTGTGTIISDDS